MEYKRDLRQGRILTTSEEKGRSKQGMIVDTRRPVERG